MQLFTDYRLGKSSPKLWSGVYGYRPDDESELSALGELFAVMSLSSHIDFDLANIGGLLFDELQSSYYTDSRSEASIAHFESAIKAVRRRVELVLEREPKLADKGIDLEMAVVVVNESSMYIATVGDSKVFVHREDNVAEVSSALIDPEVDGFMKTGSLITAQDDRVTLITSTAASTVEVDGVKESGLLNVHPDRGALLLLGIGVEVAVAVASTVEAEETTDTIIPEVEESKGMIQKEEKPLAHNFDEEKEEENDMNIEEIKLTTKPTKGLLDNTKEKAGSVVGGALASVRMFAGRAKSAVKRDDRIKMPARLQNSEFKREVSKLFALIAQQLKELWASAVNAFNLYVLRRGDRSQIYQIRKHGGDKWRYLFLAGMVILVILVLGVRQTMQDNERQAQIQSMQREVTKLSGELEGIRVEAATAALSNQFERKEAVLASIASLEEKLTTLSNNSSITSSMRGDVETIVKQAQATKDQVLQITAFTEPQLINDIGATFQGANPVAMAYVEGSIYVVDNAKGSLYRMAPTLASQASILLGDLIEPYLVVRDADSQLVVADKFAQSVIATINPSNGSIRRHTGLTLDRVGVLAAMDVWSGNKSLYVISADKRALARQGLTGNNYQAPTYGSPWRSDQSFGSAIDMAVDYWVYVLMDGVGLKRYLSGNEAAFTFRGLMPQDEQSLSKATALEVTPTKVILGDSVGRRILVFNKDPESADFLDFAGQYVYRGQGNVFSNIKEIVANPAGDQLYVLDGSSVLRLDLQAL